MADSLSFPDFYQMILYISQYGYTKNGVSSIFGPITTLFNYFNESKIELTPFFLYRFPKTKYAGETKFGGRQHHRMEQL